LRNIVGHIDLTNISNYEVLEDITQELSYIIKEIWYKHSKNVNITKYSKLWWNNEYIRDLTTYQAFRNRKMVKTAKQTFFNNKIQEITLTNKRL